MSVRPLRRRGIGVYLTRDERFEIHRRDVDDAWHVVGATEADEGLCPPERFETLREAVEELEEYLRAYDREVPR